MNVMAITVTEQAKQIFADRLKAWRAQNNTSQQRLSEMLECSLSLVSKWEIGGRYPRALYLKRKIKEVTGLDVDEIAIQYSNGGDRD